MKLKLFSFMKKSPSGHGASAGSNAEDGGDKDKNIVDGDDEESDPAGDGDEDDAAEGDEDEVPDADAVDSADSADAAEGDEEETATETVASLSAQVAELANGFNAMGAHVEQLTADLGTARAAVDHLTGNRSEEIATAASVKARNLAASQGVPADAVGGVADQGASDVPNTKAEFLAAYSNIADAKKAGAYYAKHASKFK